ncbi:YebC/PmpR family DNA-binding transcriptional regulator [Geochorda subterranea]|uniref:Probable transcriptional regulatory protein VLY81_06475 n=1 Tax=Geochorda subterranea TaxID=3109564 RepID=A0ABZ1BST3_9FIRM|nr:YebC/PmpR family DNA-binding transcriptional regulator [Limnochorda sp. LNt]WRP15794.1 YebC/PmpR family DNA-binding transcriptional regulator [Limnochorda sp. LNt]
MSGHSKWANIKHTKMKEDFRRGQLFAKLTRQIMVAARQGGPDPDANFKLRLAIDKAREANMPMDNIQRAIRRAVGQEEGTAYEEAVFEGYGPGGVAILVMAMTDNRNRTSGEIRHLFSRHGGSMAESGAVAWQFEPRGRLVVVPGEVGGSVDEEQLILDVADAGGDDVRPLEGEDGYEVICAPSALSRVREALVQRGYRCQEAQLTMVPKTTVSLEGPEAERVLRLVDALESHDDVQEVHANFDIPDEVMEALQA